MTARLSVPRIPALRLRQARPLAERCLRVGEIERLPQTHPGDTLICTRGILWVTQTGDPQDHFLLMGDRFVADRLGLVLVEALTDSACRCYTAFALE
jgi:hypothetical protein